MKPHIDYDDVIYDKTSNKSFSEKLESVQYKIALAITGYIQGTSREKKIMEFRITKFERMVQTLALHVQINEKSSIRIPE